MSASRPYALITGASSGIGAAYARALARRGHNLILVARRQERLAALAVELRSENDCKVVVHVADLADPAGLASVANLLATRGDIDLLVNNAGVGGLGPLKSSTSAGLANTINLNVLALTELSHAAVLAFTARDRGTIINIASVIAMVPSQTVSAYSGSKAYVLNFSRALQAEMAGSKVLVQVVLPGPVRSEFFQASGVESPPFPDHLFMTAEDLVDAALNGLDRGELICIPPLQDMAEWTRFEEARVGLVTAFMQSGNPAPRYSQG